MLSGFRRRTFVQAGLLTSYSSVSSARPLRSTGITPLPRGPLAQPARINLSWIRFCIGLRLWSGPLRLPAGAASRLCIPANRWARHRSRTAGSPSFPDESFPARCPQLTPESPVMSYSRCLHHRWQASPSLTGWPSFALRHEAESGSLSLRLAGSPCEASTHRIAPMLARSATC